ncbi:hypothetical protein LZ31DRAFT_537826 [Colletotrichum somersetense]|nr:hypothetical protein LZ31DRAFT_537826 [Colletotrichum somersetense]
MPSTRTDAVSSRYNYTSVIHRMREGIDEGFFQHLNVSDCFTLYNDYFSPQGNGVILIKNQSAQNPATEDSLLILVAVLLVFAFANLRKRKIDVSLAGLWRLGFGALTEFTYLVIGMPRDDPAGLISNVILANTPQLILSVVYVFYNAMFSTFLVQREFSLMCQEDRRKPLRVSEPRGLQRSSYFISLRLRYGIPFPIAVLTILGFRKYDGTMRMVATNSKAISAACHPPAEDQSQGHLLPSEELLHLII